MNEEEKRIFALTAVSEPLEKAMEQEDRKEIALETRAEIKWQLEEAGEEMNLTYPYYSDVLESEVEYIANEWLVIYGIEIVEGKGDAILSFERMNLLKIEGATEESRAFASSMGLIVPELTYFSLNAKTNMKYRLFGEGNNDPNIEKYVEKTYKRWMNIGHELRYKNYRRKRE